MAALLAVLPFLIPCALSVRVSDDGQAYGSAQPVAAEGNEDGKAISPDLADLMMPLGSGPQQLMNQQMYPQMQGNGDEWGALLGRLTQLQHAINAVEKKVKDPEGAKEDNEKKKKKGLLGYTEEELRAALQLIEIRKEVKQMELQMELQGSSMEASLTPGGVKEVESAMETRKKRMETYLKDQEQKLRDMVGEKEDEDPKKGDDEKKDSKDGDKKKDDKKTDTEKKPGSAEGKGSSDSLGGKSEASGEDKGDPDDIEVSDIDAAESHDSQHSSKRKHHSSKS
eukprot:TRINITY_DN93868_c0_g1_i1.p1 TRINITY_DN93868_c0_g1~~TRINITY_DN93868_c0_g1_i1.p1  ORF type:complete len:282 (+),score=93.93 TRINITY_DN93868_c0_g1_i1:158-1003(+)